LLPVGNSSFHMNTPGLRPPSSSAPRGLCFARVRAVVLTSGLVVIGTRVGLPLAGKSGRDRLDFGNGAIRFRPRERFPFLAYQSPDRLIRPIFGPRGPVPHKSTCAGIGLLKIIFLLVHGVDVAWFGQGHQSGPSSRFWAKKPVERKHPWSARSIPASNKSLETDLLPSQQRRLLKPRCMM